MCLLKEEFDNMVVNPMLYDSHSKSSELNSPIALHWWWYVGAVEVRHLLVIVKGEYSTNNKVALGHKIWLEGILKLTDLGCKRGCRTENWVINCREDTDRVKQSKVGGTE